MSAAPELPTLELQLPVEAASVERARRAVLGWLGAQALTLRAQTSLELVIEEVVMNLVRHAFAEPAGHDFGLRATRGDDALLLQFADAGRPFDPTAAAPRATPASIEQARPGGLGLPLLKRRTRAMRYERLDGLNLLSLTVALGGDGAPAQDSSAGSRAGS